MKNRIMLSLAITMLIVSIFGADAETIYGSESIESASRVDAMVEESMKEDEEMFVTVSDDSPRIFKILVEFWVESIDSIF